MAKKEKETLEYQHCPNPLCPGLLKKQGRVFVCFYCATKITGKKI